jgi:hypothetical protein
VAELEVTFHQLDTDPPPGWAAYRKSAGLTCAWDWSLMRARAAERKTPHLALLVRDGDTPVGIGAARLAGPLLPGAWSSHRLLGGVLDVDCLVTSAVPGLQVDGDAAGYEAALQGLRRETRRRFGHRVPAILLRQVPEHLLSTATRFPSVVLEAPPIGRHTLAYESFDAYLRTLSRSRRSEFHQLERDPDVLVTYTGRGDPRPQLDVETALMLANEPVHRHHAKWWMPKRLTGPALLTAAANHPEVDVITYRRRTGGLLGYGLVLAGGDWPISWMAGTLPHGTGFPRGMWFHRELLYTRHWIEAGVQGYISGAGADSSKVRLGHQMVPNWSVLHPLVGGDAPRFLRNATT